ncbi:MAG: bifunctional demethylmenaquinone methyltransferase/2-methoxy-6-polyprenyl-1,4-benzoquinol methylase UbiE [bacterium]
MDPKEQDIAVLFDRISKRYDLLNHLLSGFTDIRWRKKAVRISLKPNVKTILDVSTGTGDLAITYKRADNTLLIYGLDISMKMLQIARHKAQDVLYINGSGLNLPFKDNTFDLVSCAFGIRNIYPREQGIQEFYRVLKPDGIIMILEFSMPEGLIGRLYRIYFDRILPYFGNLISGTDAYTYLTSSVEAFPEPGMFIQMLSSKGFRNIHVTDLTFGIARIYTGNK